VKDWVVSSSGGTRALATRLLLTMLSIDLWLWLTIFTYTLSFFFFFENYIYLEFAPTLYATTSSSGYYEWEDAIINCYMIGELPLTQLANLAKQSFSLSLWFRRMQREHGDDYCTSWYEMKEVLRRRFAPPLESEKNILSISGSSSLTQEHQ
jgi:hypothetical protein